MKRWLMVISLAALTRPSLAALPDPAVIMSRNFFVSKVQTSVSTVVLILKGSGGGTQRRVLHIATRRQPNGIYSDLIIRFSYPPDIRGTSFLEKQRPSGHDRLWIYLPALHNVRRLVADEKRSSFFGTDFSYGDILPPRVAHYHDILVGSETVGGHPCYVIQSTPIDARIARNSGYGRKVSWIRKDDFVALKVDYYDRAGRLLKTLTASRVTPLGSGTRHWIARREVMVNHRTGHSTRLEVRSIRANVRLPTDYFAARTLSAR